jgi:hypothetical protein
MLDETTWVILPAATNHQARAAQEAHQRQLAWLGPGRGGAVADDQAGGQLDVLRLRRAAFGAHPEHAESGGGHRGPDLRVLCCADLNLERAKKQAAKYGVPAAAWAPASRTGLPVSWVSTCSS